MRLTFILTIVAVLMHRVDGQPVSFRNEVMPVLSKAGCNQGTCHGNANGKGNFKLSLRGEDADFDFLAITREAGARRVNALEPEQSLLLLKPTAQISHEGGKRFGSGSPEYRILLGWMSDGMKVDAANVLSLQKLEVTPVEKILVEPASQVQLKVTATFSNGERRDVTNLAVYDTTTDVVRVSHDGLVQREKTGETTINVRFLQVQLPARIAFVPARPRFVWKSTPEHNYLDHHVFAKLKTLRTNPSELCSDSDFIRRAYLDLLGIIPTQEEARAFVAPSPPAPLPRAKLGTNSPVSRAGEGRSDYLLPSPARQTGTTASVSRAREGRSDYLLPSPARQTGTTASVSRAGEGRSDYLLPSPARQTGTVMGTFAGGRGVGGEGDKRARLIDSLLARPEFAEFWAQKWSDLLRNEEKALDRTGVQVFYDWMRLSIARNKPLDQFARELIAARGSTYENPPANYYRANRTPITRGETTAQVFLGTRLQCAQCHNHPFDRWTQTDYYDWMGLFARVDYKIIENKRKDNLDSHEFVGEQIVLVKNEGEVKHPKTGQPAKPRFLGAQRYELTNNDDYLQKMAEWATSPQNPLFAPAQVNRIWYHLMGRGLVDPIDDFRATNPPSHPVLLDALTRDFIAHQFDMRYLLRLIMNSRAYQLSSTPNATNEDDEVNYSHVLPRRLTAEQMLDSIHQVTAVPTKFNGYPTGLRAGQIPGVEAVRSREAKPAAADQFLNLFGKPMRLLACECERNNEPTMNQAFQLISGPELNDLLTDNSNRLTQLLQSNKPNAELVTALYWTALSRRPTDKELSEAARRLDAAKDRRPALEDLTWALLNAKEFVLRK